MSSAGVGMENATSAAMPCFHGGGGGATPATVAMATWQGYLMFAGLAIVAFGVARGSLAVRNLIYQDKVRRAIPAKQWRIRGVQRVTANPLIG